MSTKVKKSRSQKVKVLPPTLIKEKEKEKGIQNEKKKKSSNLELKKKKIDHKPAELQLDEVKLGKFDKSLSSSLDVRVNLKPQSFWSKKLQDLETSTKKKKNEPYEFSGADDSENSYKKRNRKTKQKPRMQKKKQIVKSKCSKPVMKMDKVPLPKEKIKQIHRQSLFREQIMLNKERKELHEKGQQFTFSTKIHSLGITSTPALNKHNLVGSSNFLFLSPIFKEEAEYFNSINRNSPHNLTVIQDDSAFNPFPVHLGQETPKVASALERIGCKRVLRNGKLIST